MTYEISLHAQQELEETIEQLLNNAGFVDLYSFYPVKEGFHGKESNGFTVTMNFLEEKSPAESIQKATKALLSGGISSDSFLLDYRKLEETNWQDEWKKFFTSLEIGERLLVLPEWETATNSERIVVRIDPGMAFGVGGHGTTFTCLEFLDEIIIGGERLLDFGSGSGILAIAAAKLGAEEIDAIEIDPVAVENAERNIALNECAENIRAYCGGSEAIPSDAYDGILANVTADIIIENLDAVRKRVRNGGWIILSGIMENRQHDVDEFLSRRSITPVEVRQKDEWLTYLLRENRSQG